MSLLARSTSADRGLHLNRRADAARLSMYCKPGTVVIVNLWVDRRAKAELARLLKSRPNFRVQFSVNQVAASLWAYGEDQLAERALRMFPDELAGVQAIAAWYEDPDYPLPLTVQRITHNHICALAAITLFEGRLRPLARGRRRPEKNRPQHLRPAPPVI